MHDRRLFRSGALRSRRHQDRQLRAVPGRWSSARHYNSNVFQSPSASSDDTHSKSTLCAPRFELGRHALEFSASGDLEFPQPVSRRRTIATIHSKHAAASTSRASPTFRRSSRASSAGEPLGASTPVRSARAPKVIVDRARGRLQPALQSPVVQLRGSVDRYVPTATTDRCRRRLEQRRSQLHALRAGGARNVGVQAVPLRLLRHRRSISATMPMPRSRDGINRTLERPALPVRRLVRQHRRNPARRHQPRLRPGRRRKTRELHRVDGLLIDADLTWRMTALTTLLFTAATDVAETTTADSGGVLERYVRPRGLRHKFTSVPRRHAGFELL